MRGYLGLGSNVGDRLANLRAARDGLAAGRGGHAVDVVASSPVYETEPQGELLEQPDFLNACLAVETELSPEDLLEVCKRLEAVLGRQAPVRRHGPRPIDIDVLLLGDRTHRSERLILPHPGLLERRFVLAPLLDLDPELALPDGTRLADALPALAGQRVERLGPL